MPVSPGGKHRIGDMYSSLSNHSFQPVPCWKVAQLQDLLSAIRNIPEGKLITLRWDISAGSHSCLGACKPLRLLASVQNALCSHRCLLVVWRDWNVTLYAMFVSTCI